MIDTHEAHQYGLSLLTQAQGRQGGSRLRSFGIGIVAFLDVNELAVVVWETTEDQTFVTWTDGVRQATDEFDTTDEALASLADDLRLRGREASR